MVIRGGDTGSSIGGCKAPGSCPVRRRVRKLVKREIGASGCDASVGFGLRLVLPYLVVAVTRFAAEAQALKTHWISFFLFEPIFSQPCF